MDEHERLLGETNDGLERALLEAGREDRASPEARRRTLAALGLAEPGPGVAVQAKSRWSAAWVKVAGMAAFALGAAALALGFGRTAIVGAPPQPPPPSAREEPPHAPTASVTEAAPLAPPTAPPPSPAPSGPHARRGSGVAIGRVPSTTPQPSGHEAGTLAEEIATIDRARRALYDHRDVHEALRALDEHDRRFPRGALGPEAAVLRVEALLAAGDRPAAEALGARLLAESPSGPLADRVRALLRR
jgi:hypothetical protein